MAEREFRTTPQWPIATTPLSGDELVEVWKGGKQYYVPFSELGGMPAAHSGTHKHGGDDEVGTLDNLAYEIPKLDADGLIDSRVSDASTTTKGKVQLAGDGEEDATKPPTSTDSRLKDARPPTAHAAQHIAGTDVIADATVSNSGLMSAADKVKADATIPANIPTADQKAALAGSYGTPSATNKYITDEDGRIPTAGEKAALVGSYGTPSATNKYVTESDPVLSSIGGGGGGTGPDLLGIGQIGDGLSISGAGWPALAGLNSTDVAFSDRNTDQLRTYTFNGVNWIQKGNSLSITNIGYPALAGLNSTDVAFIDGDNNELRCYTFDGTNWTQKGNGLSITSVGACALASLSSTDVAFIDGTNDELRCYTFNGTNWTQKGNCLSITNINYPALAGLNSTDIAFIDGTNDELRCYTFNGTNWTQKGSGLLITGNGYPALAGLNSTDVAFIDNVSDELRCYTFDGTDWTQKGSGLSIANTGEIALASLSSTDVAFIDGNGKELRTYNFLFGYDSASVNIAADYEVPEIATGKSIVIRRTSAYDGDPVTISPPSGATFEGLASLSLYGQYSFVELERISSTVFAIKDESFVGPVDCSSRVAEYTGDGIPLIPDNVAGRTYFQDAWETTDGWKTDSTASLSTSDGKLKIAASSSSFYAYRNIPSTSAKSMLIMAKASRTGTYAFANAPGIVFRTMSLSAGIWYTVNEYVSGTVSQIAVSKTGATIGDTIEVNFAYIGTGAYDTPALDRAGNGNNLTLNAVTPVNGKYGKEIKGNGYESFARASSPVIGATGTIAIYGTMPSRDFDFIFDNRNAVSEGINGICLLRVSNTLLSLRAFKADKSQYILNIPFTSSNKSVIVTFDGTNAIVYVDGVYASTGPFVVIPGTSNLTLLGNISSSGNSDSQLGVWRYDSRIWTADEARAWSLNPISIDSRV